MLAMYVSNTVVGCLFPKTQRNQCRMDSLLHTIWRIALSVDEAIVLGLNHWLATSPSLGLVGLRFNQLTDFVIVCALVALWFRRGAESDGVQFYRQRLILFVATLPIAYVIARVLQKLIQRPRPIVALPLQRAMPETLWNDDKFTFHGWGALPSDHAVLLAVFVVFLFAFEVRFGVLATVFLGVFTVFRIGLGYHWMGDIVAGVLIGAALAWAALKLEEVLRPLLSRILQQTEVHPTLFYTAAFVWLLDFAHGFMYTQDLAKNVLHLRLFH